MLNYT